MGVIYDMIEGWGEGCPQGTKVGVYHPSLSPSHPFRDHPHVRAMKFQIQLTHHIKTTARICVTLGVTPKGGRNS